MGTVDKNCWMRDPQHLDEPLNPVVCFRRDFTLSSAGNVGITVAALGVFDLYLNGEKLTGKEFVTIESTSVFTMIFHLFLVWQNILTGGN